MGKKCPRREVFSSRGRGWGAKIRRGIPRCHPYSREYEAPVKHIWIRYSKQYGEPASVPTGISTLELAHVGVGILKSKTELEPEPEPNPNTPNCRSIRVFGFGSYMYLLAKNNDIILTIVYIYISLYVIFVVTCCNNSTSN
jgi:hypothetical protein